LDIQENIFVAVVWVYSGDLRLLEMFPSVLKVDDANNEKRPHMTFTQAGMYSHGYG